jgi:hypothetical protein
MEGQGGGGGAQGASERFYAKFRSQIVWSTFHPKKLQTKTLFWRKFLDLFNCTIKNLGSQWKPICPWRLELIVVRSWCMYVGWYIVYIFNENKTYKIFLYNYF